MFKQPWNIIIYLIIALSLLVDALSKLSFTLWLALPVLFLWDIIFSLQDESFIGKEPIFILDQVIHSKTLISYFLPLYSLYIGLLFTASSDAKTIFMEAINSAGISHMLIVTPLILACVALLLIPVHISKTEDHIAKSTNSLRALLAIVIFSQQATVLIFAYTLLKLIPNLI